MGVAKITTLAAAAALACLLAAAPAQARRDVPRGFYGAVLDGAVAQAPDAQWARMARAGVESVRTVFSWEAAQPSPGAPPSFERTDRLVAGAVAHGIEPLPVVIYAPQWARADPTVLESPPRDPAEYASFLAALVRRYGSSGSFWAEHPELPRRPLRYWQVWNEPQLRYQWYTPDFAKGYGALLRAAYKAVKRADPRAKVVLAGATNLAWDALDELYRRGGIHGFFDVAALHPYTSTAERVLRAVALFRAVLRRHGDGRVPLWITELGWPASKGKVRSGNTLQTTPRGAAARLSRAYDLLARTRRRPAYGVSRAYWYTWASSYEGGISIFDYTGLYRYAGGRSRATPQLVAYRRSARRHEGCVKSAAGACVRRGG
ncbi:MAG: hypothetical protein IRZ21_09955 [Thermoleophilaceae bacterium]|nr:hypothetical protein [Thermoleophilaceae bacterium]